MQSVLLLYILLKHTISVVNYFLLGSWDDNEDSIIPAVLLWIVKCGVESKEALVEYP